MTGLTLSEIERLSAEDLETVKQWIDDQADAAKDAARGR